MSLRNLEEKKLLLKFARIMGEPIDPALVESIEKEERLLKALEPKPAVASEALQFDVKSVKTPTKEDPEATEQQMLLPPDKKDIVKMVTNYLDPPKQKTAPSATPQLPDLYKKELDGVRRSIADIVQKMGSLSWGGGGTGSVKIIDMDDLNREGLADIDHVMRYNAATQHFFFDNLSGDQGPIRSMRFDMNGPGINTEPGMIAWNTTEECLDIFQPDNTTLQVGLENYIRVSNHTGNTLPQGTLVSFAGVNGDANPSVVPLLANSTFYPVYTVGVLTEDIETGQAGRATTFGKVRNLDTGMFNVGDILYASPAEAGKLTNVQPTAPNATIFIAAVMTKSNTDGIILVRPTIIPKLHYGSFASTQTQHAAASNTATAVTFNKTEFASGHSVVTYQTVANSAIEALRSGLYNYQFSLQFSSSSSARARVWIWARKNGVDIPDSAALITIESNGGVDAPGRNFVVSMQAGDKFQLMWATDHFDKVSMLYSGQNAFCPQIPSALLSVTEVTL